MITTSQRTEFWRRVDATLDARGLEPASNAEIADAQRLTTCARQAAEFVERARCACACCGTPTRHRDGSTPMCSDCRGRMLP